MTRWAIEVVWPEPHPARQFAVGGYWTRRGALAAMGRLDRLRALVGGAWRYEVVRQGPKR